MQIVAIVTGITTIEKHLPDRPKIDIVRLSYRGRPYTVWSEAGTHQIGDEVMATAIGTELAPICLKLQ